MKSKLLMNLIMMAIGASITVLIISKWPLQKKIDKNQVVIESLPLTEDKSDQISILFRTFIDSASSARYQCREPESEGSSNDVVTINAHYMRDKVNNIVAISIPTIYFPNYNNELLIFNRVGSASGEKFENYPLTWWSSKGEAILSEYVYNDEMKTTINDATDDAMKTRNDKILLICTEETIN